MLELISETNYRETMENTVEPKLASIREELSLPLEDGGALHAELYEQPTATRAVVVLHGYTESGEKIPRNDVVFPAIGLQRLRHRPSRPRQERARGG